MNPLGVEQTELYPRYAAITPVAWSAIMESTESVYRQQGTEWGGLLWGVVRGPSDLDRGADIVPVVAYATVGVCRATRVACEILDESWRAGQQELVKRGLQSLVCLGDFHSHPGMGIFLSQHSDVPSFWAHAYQDYWMSMVVDPFGSPCYGVFSQDGRETLGLLPVAMLDGPSLSELRLPSWLADASDIAVGTRR